MRMAMVGAGAIAELGHLPAVAVSERVLLTAIVDTNLQRARDLSQKFGGVYVTDTIEGLKSHADFACVAVPHKSHETVSQSLMAEGLDILVEKPLATTVAGCDFILREAEAHGRIVGVAMPRRYSPSGLGARAVIKSGVLGRVLSFGLESGSAETWPAKSSYLLDPKQSGGGVLIANGCHDLDFVSWLLGPINAISAKMNSFAGTESDCLLDLSLKDGVHGTIELSRVRNLKNRMFVTGDKAKLTFDVLGEDLTLDVGEWKLKGMAQKTSETQHSGFSFTKIMANQLDDFACSVANRTAPKVDGVAGRDVAALIESCYASAKSMNLDWSNPIEFYEKVNQP